MHKISSAFYHHLFLAGIFFFAFFGTGTGLAAEKPTKDLEKAIKSGKKVILFEGKENEDFTVRSGVTITGTSPEKSIISGDVKLENGAALSNITVSGRDLPITVEKGASVTLTNVTIRGGKDAGIVTLEGGGTLTLKNSRITKNRKGLYILPGKNLLLSGNIISGNAEEGLDVRLGTTGVISGNQFLGNGEGGAEIIGGSARLVIEKNTFSGNKADGLTIQSYSGGGKAPGSVKIIGNTFTDNRSFGLSCESPSLGGAEPVFYRRTITATDNIFRGNKAGMIDRECGGVANRLSLPEGETEEKVEIQEEASPTSAVTVFEETVSALHAAEHALELRLNEKSGNRFARMFRLQPMNANEQQAFEVAFAALDDLREKVNSFPREEEMLSEQERQDILIESFRRREELRESFDRLQHPSFPKSLLIFLF